MTEANLCYHFAVNDGSAGAIVKVSAGYEDLDLVVLFGSRARGDATIKSDWDVGYLAGRQFDREAFLADVVVTLGTERVDLVDLQRAGGLVRFRAARDGRPLFQRAPAAFAHFWFDAVSFWCDAGPLIQAGYEDILSGLPG